MDARAETGFLPDFASVPKSVLRTHDRRIFLLALQSRRRLRQIADWLKLFRLADRYDFTVLADECYCEIYDGAPPVGALDVRYAIRPADLNGCSPSTRCPNAPTCQACVPGFVVGRADLIADMHALPQHLRTASADSGAQSFRRGLGRRSAMSKKARARYRERFAIARRILGNHSGFRLPAGGFYLWLDVGDGPAFAKALWRETGVRVLPGAFMCVEKIPGDPASNPGYPLCAVGAGA